MTWNQKKQNSFLENDLDHTLHLIFNYLESWYELKLYILTDRYQLVMNPYLWNVVKSLTTIDKIFAILSTSHKFNCILLYHNYLHYKGASPQRSISHQIVLKQFGCKWMHLEKYAKRVNFLLSGLPAIMQYMGGGRVM